MLCSGSTYFFKLQDFSYYENTLNKVPSGSKLNMTNSLHDINTIYHASDYKTTYVSSWTSL